ncbi:hypothetical protein A33Q_1395 [Indibacter alkaliphilus LW1]|uniref:Uncharacterized protein n=1 Tax=Indibacter alkaliphilus (strain CCUG 57479 / KCTC 22604 / LW1) TaxID=1189612 RepID=S2E2M8_INDAL|nr:hypothetical protein A33Q_1395 [Indibacter alkaliphilus LW1]
MKRIPLFCFCSFFGGVPLLCSTVILTYEKLSKYIPSTFKRNSDFKNHKFG